MAQLTVQQIDADGLETAYVAAAAGGDYFINDGKTLIDVVNGSGGDLTLTFAGQKACEFGTIHNQTCVVQAGERRQAGPFPKYRFNDANGYVQITYSGVTSLTIAASKL
jgi:hypothetical protein